MDPKINCVKKKVRSKKVLVQKMKVQKNIGPNKWVQKIWVPKKSWAQKILGAKILNKIFWV